VTLVDKTDEEILDIAKPILSDIIEGSNNKDWSLFSKHMPIEHSSNPDIKADVLGQWQKNVYMTSLSETPEFLGVIRRPENVLVVWKQKSSVSEGEFLQKLYLKELYGAVKQIGVLIE